MPTIGDAVGDAVCCGALEGVGGSFASRLSSALPVASGLSADTGLLAGTEAIAGAGLAPGLTPAGGGEIVGVFPGGVVTDEGVLFGGEDVPVDDVLLDGDVPGELDAVDEQLGVDDPVYPLLEWAYGVVPPVPE